MDPVASLSSVEGFLLRSYTERGERAFVMSVSVGSVLLSVALTTTLLVLIDTPRTEFIWGIFISLLVPSLVAPAVAGSLSRLLTAIDQARVELHHLARTDPLTEVLNRRAFEVDGQERIDALGAVAVVAMIDLDDFKTVNDRHGHAVGDLALVRLAAKLQAACNPGDVIGRMGGDEFAVVTRPTSRGAVDELIQRLIGACDLSEVVDGLTASIGWVVVLPPQTLEHALAQADRALYRRKRAHAGQDGSQRARAANDGA